MTHKVTTLNLYQKLNDNHLTLTAAESQGLLYYKSPTSETLPVQISNLYVVSADDLHTFSDVALELYNVNSQINNISTNVDTEVTRATAAEAVLTNSINNMLENIDPAAIDSFTEVVKEFQKTSDVNSTLSNLSSSLDVRLKIVENLLRSLFGAEDLSSL